MLIDTTSIICFSSTKAIFVKTPDVLVAHMQNCASPPQMFNTKILEDQFWKTTYFGGGAYNDNVFEDSITLIGNLLL